MSALISDAFQVAAPILRDQLIPQQYAYISSASIINHEKQFHFVRMRAARPSRRAWGVGQSGTETPHALPEADDPRAPRGLCPTRS
jgi:hypothetical protein